MNREIKFKIFADKKWYYKCLVGNTNNTTDESWTCPLVWLEDKKEWVHCDNGIICQYTGLKDKNGVEIYEGDIVRFEVDDICTKPFYINYDIHDCSFSLFRKGIVDRGLLAHYSKDIAIIGNIYENKELLENE